MANVFGDVLIGGILGPDDESAIQDEFLRDRRAGLLPWQRDLLVEVHRGHHDVLLRGIVVGDEQDPQMLVGLWVRVDLGSHHVE